MIVLLLAVAMVFSLVACGDKSDDERRERRERKKSSSQSDPYNGQNQDNPFSIPNDDNPFYGSNQGDSGNRNYDVKAKLYRVGEDMLVLSLDGRDVSKFYNTTLCLEFMADEQLIDGNVEMIFDEYFSVRHTTRTGESSYETRPVDDIGGMENIIYMKGDTSAYFEVTRDGMWNKIPELKGMFKLKNPNGEVLASGNTSELVSAVSETGISEIRESAYSGFKAKTKGQTEWEGNWMSSGSSRDTVYISVKVLDGGVIKVSGIVNDSQVEYYLEEESFTRSQYEVNGKADLCREVYPRDYDYENSISMSYNSFEWENLSSGPSISFRTSKRLEDNNYAYVDATLTKVNGTWHQMPEGYKDEDVLGAYKRPADAGDAEFFTPVTDDYMITFWHSEDGMSFYSYSDRKFSVKDRALLRSFNKNGYGLVEVDKFIFDTSAEAKLAYETVTADASNVSYKVYNYKDNVVYITYDWSNYYGGYNTTFVKKDELEKYSSKFYIGAHFLYDVQTEKYYKYSYFSKPYTTTEFEITPLQMTFWQNKDSHVDCKENDVYWLCSDIDEYYFNISIEITDSTKAKELPGHQLYPGRNIYVRYRGETLEGIYAGTLYDDEGKRHYVMVVNDYRIVGNEITLTQYVYDIDNPFSEAVTLDNYKTLTPKESGTYTFEIKIKENRY